MKINGKYNKAKIFTNNIDSTTISQIINLCNQQTFKDSQIRIMPDCHCGKGCTIGTTMTITDKVVPNLVGVDIGCGMATIDLHLVDLENINLNKLDNVIRKYVPHGFNIHNRSREKILKEKYGLDLEKLYCKDNVDIERAYKSAGTLGGGNHFIEINKTNEGKLYLTVHTGSRNLGKQIAEYYQKQAIQYCTNKYEKDSISHIIADLKSKGQENLIEKTIQEYKTSFKKPTDDLCYLEDKLMTYYLHDMLIAQRFAEINRILIIADMIYNYNDGEIGFRSVLDDVDEKIIECIHNFIEPTDKILRKGAISAYKDELVIIPINMRDGVILGRGKGNPDWNYSAPHGAGRILSRGQAKSNISIDEYRESMKDIFTTCVNQATLDEAPQAYKPIEDIVNNIKDTVEILDIMKPIYNFKSN